MFFLTESTGSSFGASSLISSFEGSEEGCEASFSDSSESEDSASTIFYCIFLKAVAILFKISL